MPFVFPLLFERAISMATSRMATNEMAADRVVLIGWLLRYLKVKVFGTSNS